MGGVNEKVFKEDKQACMYCKYMDNHAGFMTTYSYCSDDFDQKCIRNYYLYIHPQDKCEKYPQNGWDLDIDEDCKSKYAAKGVCPPDFVSLKDFKKKLIFNNKSLAPNTKCTI